MDVTTAINTRRAVKHFDPDHRMSQEQTDRILSLAMLSPTAFNIQNWRFVVVKDPELRGRIREKSFNQAQVTDASLLVVMCADLRSWDKDPDRYWCNAPDDVRCQLVGMLRGFYKDNEQLQRDEAMRSCGLAAMTLMLAAREMGYDSCPMDGFDFDAVGELIGLPEDHVISMFVAIGKALQPARERPGQLPAAEVVISDGFPAEAE